MRPRDQAIPSPEAALVPPSLTSPCFFLRRERRVTYARQALVGRGVLVLGQVGSSLLWDVVTVVTHSFKLGVEWSGGEPARDRSARVDFVQLGERSRPSRRSRVPSPFFRDSPTFNYCSFCPSRVFSHSIRHRPPSTPNSPLSKPPPTMIKVSPLPPLLPRVSPHSAHAHRSGP